MSIEITCRRPLARQRSVMSRVRFGPKDAFECVGFLNPNSQENNKDILENTTRNRTKTVQTHVNIVEPFNFEQLAGGKFVTLQLDTSIFHMHVRQGFLLLQ